MKRFALAPLLFAAAALLAAAAHAQDAQETPIWQREPFDRITLTEEHGSRVYEIQPLELDKGKKFEDLKPTEKASIRLVDQPDKQLLVARRHIAKYEPHLQMVLEEAARLVQQDEFDVAFQAYAYLLENAPNLPGLKEAVDLYLFKNADALIVQERYDAALSILEDLYRRYPNASTVVAKVSGAIDRILAGYVAQEDWRSARRMLARLRRQYRAGLAEICDKWEGELSRIAAEHRDAAIAHRDNKRFFEAHESLREMIKVWPPVPLGKETNEQIMREYPLIVVGVSSQAAAHDPRSLTSFPARRAGRLMTRLLSEFQGYGPEGGLYASPIARLSVTDDDMQLVIEVAPELARQGTSWLTGYDLSQKLLGVATPGSPDYLSAWGALVSQIAVERVNRVRCVFRQPHVLPAALLQTPLGGPSESESYGGYGVANATPEQTQFIIQEERALTQLGQPAVVIERAFPTRDEAVRALQRGDIEILDRVPPYLARRLAEDRTIRVVPYATPTTHMLIPNPDKPFTGNRAFRRAIQHAIASQVMLDQLILRGQSIRGCKPVSGPFPAGVVDNDPMAYANDDGVRPRGFDPTQASVLVVMAKSELSQAAKKREKPEPKLEPITLAHPATEEAREVCESIELQLNQLGGVGVKCVRKELPPELFLDLRGWHRKPEGADADRAALADADLVYAEIGMLDPIVDARRLLGEDGLAGGDNPYIRLALHQIDSASNWREARAKLLELHRLVHTELVVIPLWQMVNHLAYRAGLENVPRRPVTLYQDIEKWRIDPTAKSYGDDIDG